MDAIGSGEIDWLREVRRHREGVMIACGQARAVRVVIDGRSGHLVTPVEPIELRADEMVVFLPRESDDTVQLLCRPEEIGAAKEEVCDRWGAYHGKTDLRRWARLVIEGGKRDEWVANGAELAVPSVLRLAEGGLVRLLNADPRALGAACERLARMKVADPLAVGVDPHGVDVRARFGIVRLEFEAAACDEAGATRMIQGILGAASAGAGGGG
jgi:hypothetical protein